MTLSTHVFGYIASDMVKDHSDNNKKEDFFYLMTLSTHVFGYIASDIVKDHLDNKKRKNFNLFNDTLNTFLTVILRQTYMVKRPFR